MTRDSSTDSKNSTGATLLEQLAGLLDEAAGAADAMRHDGEAFVRMKLEKIAAEMDFVPRDEFEVVKAMALKAQAESRAVKNELTGLRRQLARVELRQNKYKPLRKPVRNSREKSQSERKL